MIIWQTEAEIEKASKKLKTAITSYQKQWLHLSTATEKILRTRLKEKGHNFSVGSDCALCNLFYADNNCNACPLLESKDFNNGHCCQAYVDASYAWYAWEGKYGSFGEWRKTARIMYQLVAKL